jgi:hypothetical protein
MRRIANRSANGQEAPMVITPKAAGRLLAQVAGASGEFGFPGSRKGAFAVAPMLGELEKAMVSGQAEHHQIRRTPCERLTASAPRWRARG